MRTKLNTYRTVCQRALILLLLATLALPGLQARPAQAAPAAGAALPAGPNLPPEADAAWWLAVQARLQEGPGPDGLSADPDWNATGEGNGDGFGWSVASAGDVNGDGYADVIVGAYGYSGGDDQGKVYVYHGSASGLAATPNWTATGEASDDRFGSAVAAAGDVNGDGYSDVIVGARGYDDGASADTGRAYVYYGSASGLAGTPAWTATGENGGDGLGSAVAAAGDVDGDGYADVIVGATGYSGSMGRAYVYHGSSGGLAATPDWTADGEAAGDEFGFSTAAAGDVNGDGYSDVIVGAHGYDDGGDGDTGRAYAYHGSAGGLATSPNWTATGENGADSFGGAVSTAGDVNGDGYTDVIVGAYGYPSGAGRGRAYAYVGSSSGLVGSPTWTATGENDGDSLGWSVAAAGDTDGDGYADVIVGAFVLGRAYLYQGAESGLESAAAWQDDGENTGDFYGMAVAAAGDVDGDGYADVIVGATGYPGGASQGAAYVYHGAAELPSASEDWSATGEVSYAFFGTSVAPAGDVNGDGYSDVIVGATGYSDGGHLGAGKAYLYQGSPAGLSTTPNWTATGEDNSNYFGLSVASAGDVNGDGYADVIVGAPYYDDGASTDAGKAYLYHGSPAGLSATPAWTATGEAAEDYFGSVATAGDVNGDGYADVVVGAYGYPGGDRQGKAYVYHGSAGGLATTPAWTATGEADYNGFGSAVAAAGNVNGDGCSDVIVGAHLYDDGASTDAGKAYIYHGSPAGLSSTPNWTATGENSEDELGSAVATAGDVNGDGYADVIVGAPHYDDGGDLGAGKAYVYQGSPAGLSATPTWTATGENFGDNLSSAVATAGDVNGDGYADVIVGALYYDDGGNQSAGKAYLYLGHANGLSPASGWTATGENGTDMLGSAVAAAGDVDGDGYADVLVGADHYSDGGNVDAGKAYLYHGNSGRGRSIVPRQLRGDGSGLPVQPWGLSQAGDRFKVQLWASHPGGRALVALQVEVCEPSLPMGSPGCTTYTADTWSDTGTAGVQLHQTITGLDPEALYRWRARLLYTPLHAQTPGPNPAHTPWRRLQGQALEADLRTSACSYGVTMTPPSSSRMGLPGSTVAHTFQASNTGTCPDTYDVALSGSTWPTNAPTTLGPLDPGASATLTVTVDIPPGANDGESDSAGVTITSQGSPTATASSSLQTTAVTPDIDVQPLLLTATLNAGQAVSRSLTIANIGGADLNWTLAESPTVDWLDESPLAGSTAPSSSSEVAVSFDTAGLADGAYSTTLEVGSDDPDEPLLPVQVTLVVTSACVPVYDLGFTVHPAQPVAGQPASFGASAGGTIPITFTWTFGDGGSAVGLSAAHTYSASGRYSVTLSATNACGTAQTMRTVVVVETSPFHAVYLPLVFKNYP